MNENNAAALPDVIGSNASVAPPAGPARRGPPRTGSFARSFATARRRAERQSGQAIVLGTAGLFIMALAVLATLNLGQAVHERIRLQNAADAAAYSIAAREARAFNYFAFTNRTQAAHYSAAMTLQSYLSFATYALALVMTASDLSYDAATGWDMLSQIAVFPVLRAIFNALRIISQIFGTVVRILGIVLGYALMYGDALIASTVEGIGELNVSIGRAAVNEGLRVNRLLITGGYPILKRNAPNLDFTPPHAMFFLALLNATLNTIEYRRVFDRGASQDCSIFGLVDLGRSLSSGGQFPIQDRDNDDEEVVAARQIMTEVANATRLGQGSGAGVFVTNRSNLRATLPLYSYARGQRHGQTRLIDDRGDAPDDYIPGPRIKRLHVAGSDEDGADTDAEPHYHTGNVLAADDYEYSMSGGFYWIGASIVEQINSVGAAVVAEPPESDWSFLGSLGDADVGYHYGYKFENGEPETWSSGMGRLPLNQEMINQGPLGGAFRAAASSPTRTFQELSDSERWYSDDHFGSHQWPGIAPFVNFDPRPRTENGMLGDYNQPSTWIFANLSPDRLNQRGERGEQPWSMRFTYSTGDIDSAAESFPGGRAAGGAPSLDTTIGTSRQAIIPFMTGLNAVARGMVYYHRPAGGASRGNWQEHPNFFNPYWHARLAPVAEKLKQLYDAYVGGAIRMDTSGDDGAVRQILSGGVNILRNFLGDVFFNFITSIMTH